MSYVTNCQNQDCGYAWIVAIATAIVEFFSRSVANSFGVLFNEFKKNLDVGNTEISLLAGLVAGTSSIAAPLVSILVTRYTCRTLVLIGGLIITTGLCLSYFADTVIFILITFGLICGLGQAFTYISSVIIVNQYFTKRFTIANGIRLAGVSTGTIVLSLLIPFLISEYGINGTVLIMGSLSLHIIPIGILYRPRKKLQEKKSLPTISGKINETFKDENEMTKQSTHSPAATTSHFNPKTQIKLISIHIKDEEKLSPLEDKIFYCENYNDFEFNKSNKSEKTEENAVFSLIKDPLFVMVIFSMAFIVLQFTNLLAIIPAHGENIGCTKTESAMLITAESIAELTGRLNSGWILTKLKVNLYNCYILLCLLTSINTVGISLANSFWMLISFTTMLGIIEGIQGTITAPLLAIIFGKEKMHTVLGIFNPLRALLVIFAPLSTGYMADYYQSFMPSIMFLACVSFVSFLLFLLSLCLPNYKKLQKEMEKLPK